MLWSNIPPHVCVSRGRMLRLCAYSMNSKIGGNYYAQRKKMHAQRELNPRPWL
jgi:hypothetical protein